MKKIALAAVLAAATGAMAWDEYGALGARKLEVDAMFNYYGYTGGYDEDGTKQDADGSPAAMNPVLGLKYGIIDGLDVELAVPYLMLNKDYAGDDLNGLDRVNLGVKYTHPGTGLGGFLAVDLPLGSKDIVGEDPATSIHVAAQYIKTFGPVFLADFVKYQLNLEVEDVKKADMLEIYVKPQYNVTDKIGPYVGIDYAFNVGDGKKISDPTEGLTSEEIALLVSAGEDLTPTSKEYDPETSALTIKPGVNWIVNDAFAVEANVPFTVLGKNSDAYWGVYAAVYYTIGL